MKESCFLVINVNIKQQKKSFWKNMLSLSMNVSSIIVVIVENNLHNKVISKHIFSLFMKLSSILVICVIIKLQ